MSQQDTLKRRPYGNCRVEDINGNHIFNAGTNKVNWYLSKHLAVITNENPLTIRLNFKTNGPGWAGDDFYLQKRENRCVVCGSFLNLTHHHIVPMQFRKHFPNELKTHNSYDVLPVCKDDHEKYEIVAAKYCKELYNRYGINQQSKIVLYHDIIKIIKAASALLTHNKYIPDRRKEALLDVLRRYYERQEITNDDMKHALNLSPSGIRDNYIAEGKQLVDKLTTEKDFYNFVVEWRKHFICNTDAKYLPNYWIAERQLDYK